jgi:secreted Zn-dependent insulinase-like peptidase
MNKIIKWIALIIMLAIASVVGKELSQQYFDEKNAIANPFPEVSPLHEPYENYITKLWGIPEFKAQFHDALDKEQAFAIGMSLSQKGMRRLDDISLERRMEIVALLLNNVDVETCAFLAGIRSNNLNTTTHYQQQYLSALEKLDEAMINDYLNLTSDAVVAELKRYPAPQIDEQAVEKAMNNLLEQLSQADTNRLMYVIRNREKSSLDDTDACWANRTLYSQALEMDINDRRIIARAFVSE